MRTYLADQLHVTVLNTVVDHLDIVASTLVTDPVTAGLAVTLGGNALEDVLDVGPGGLVTTGHERGTVTGTLLTTRDTAADEADALLGEVPGAAVGVGEVGVTTVNDDVALLEEGQEGLNEVVDGLAGHDEEHDTARALQLGAELLDGVGANNGLAWGKRSVRLRELDGFCRRLTLGLIVQEAVNLGGGTVEGADGETVVSSIEDQVLAHDGQTDEAEISTGNKVRRSADINAGETGTIVSDRVLKSIAGQMRVGGW